ncbi:hypothetical protein D3C72_2395690 [compost metagenome]
MLADHKLVAAAPIAEVVKVDHPFIREYFLGERAQRALQALQQPGQSAPSAQSAPPARRDAAPSGEA